MGKMSAPLDSETRQIEEAVFETALGLEGPEAQRAFLERVFPKDPEAVARYESLLESARESTSFFLEARDRRTDAAAELLEELPVQTSERTGDETGASGAAAWNESPGGWIGRYRLIERIGEGGCGIVYEAEQEEPVRRRVALKVIRVGMDTEAVISRFEVERRALALMDHPNIARVLDAGASETGRPYFVMELVRGERITTFCDERNYGTTARLELFIQVCQAIQHAHQKGIIHRDIKPSNILVSEHDGRAVPKVIDFGVAKATQGELTGRTMFTVRDQLIGTPAYMSPEQIDMNGMDIDTRSDVYSLGVLLYELLAGRPPFDGEELVKSGISEMRRTLMESEPPTPSTLLSAAAGEDLTEIAAHRGAEPGRLVSQLRGDLDWVVMRAMEKDRSRRYKTVNSLTMEVQRFLKHEPVLARRPSRLYLMRKFVRRNRVACISGVAIGLSLIGGLGASTWLYLREREALAAQERLGREAEEARARETYLRRQAQARANVSRVAMLLSESRLSEADALLRENPLESIEPSYEAADVFRSLGNWNAIHGRWAQAAQSFVLLNQANRLDDPQEVLTGFDLLVTAPALVEHGDLASYEAFRSEALNRYLPVESREGAQHLLKSCLLAPAGDRKLERLRPAAERLMQVDSPELTSVPAWEAFALTIYHYRLGDAEGVLRWGRETMLDTVTNDARTAGVDALRAIAHHRLGDAEAARLALARARKLVFSPSEPAFEPRGGDQGFWFDWAVARILLREAEGIAGGGG